MSEVIIAFGILIMGLIMLCLVIGADERISNE